MIGHTKVYSFSDSVTKFIYQKRCDDWGDYRGADNYYLYSATLGQSAWHVDKAKAWIDVNTIAKNITNTLKIGEGND
jgi:hypothetical protein